MPRLGGGKFGVQVFLVRRADFRSGRWLQDAFRLYIIKKCQYDMWNYAAETYDQLLFVQSRDRLPGPNLLVHEWLRVRRLIKLVVSPRSAYSQLA